MDARKKLNSGYIGGSLLIAGVAGLFVESWWVFAVVLGFLLALHLYEGNIRPDPDPR